MVALFCICAEGEANLFAKACVTRELIPLSHRQIAPHATSKEAKTASYSITQVTQGDKEFKQKYLAFPLIT